MENTELYTIESTQSCDPSVQHDGANVLRHEDGMLITSNLALAAWLVASRRLEFAGVAPCKGFEPDYDCLFNDPDGVGLDYANAFYGQEGVDYGYGLRGGDPAVGARSMFNALDMIESMAAGEVSE